MNFFEKIIAFVFTKLFSGGLVKMSSQYSCKEFYVINKKENLDTLTSQAKDFGESQKWKLADSRNRNGERIITWVEGGFGSSWPRTIGFEARETLDKYYIWTESKYNKNQMVNRGENKKNIETLKNFFDQYCGILPSNLTWDEAAKQVPLK